MAIRDQAVRTFPAQVAQKAAQVRSNVAAKAAAKPVGVSDGLITSDATEGEFQAARARAAMAGPRAPTATPVQPSSLAPHEVASFDAQTGGRFSAANPSAPTLQRIRGATNAATAPLPGAAAPPPAASISEGLVQPRVPLAQRAGSIAADAGNAVGQVARMGTAPVVTTPGKFGPRTAPGQRAGTGAALAGIGLASAADSIGRSTADYRQRLGLDPVAAGTSPGAEFAQDLGVRALGVGSDLGATILDAGTGIVNSVRKLGGAQPISTFDSHFADRGAQGAPNVADPAANPAAAKPAGISSDLTLAPSTYDDPARQARTRANDGITPVADRTGAADEVIGTFNGKPITKGASDAMAGAQSFGGATTPSISDNLAPATGGMPSADMGGSGSESRVSDITNPNTAAGKLYAQMSADKTPSGKRAASDFLQQYVSGGTQELGSKRGLAGDQLSAQTSLQRGREGDAAAVKQEGIRAKGGKAAQYVFNDDGSISQISDGLISPVLDKDGKPGKASKGKISAKDQEDLISTRLDQLDPGKVMTAEERQAARDKILQEYAASVGAGLDG